MLNYVQLRLQFKGKKCSSTVKVFQLSEEAFLLYQPIYKNLLNLRYTPLNLLAERNVGSELPIRKIYKNQGPMKFNLLSKIATRKQFFKKEN